MLERHRVDDVDGSIGCRVLTEEQTVDGIAGVFESMNDEFGVGEVLEAKYWVRYDAKGRYELVWKGRTKVYGRIREGGWPLCTHLKTWA